MAERSQVIRNAAASPSRSGRRAWTVPRMRVLAAGSASSGAGPGFDGLEVPS